MRTSIAMQMCLFDGDRVTAITTPCAHRPPSTPRTGNRKCPHIRFGPRQLLSSHFVQQVLRVNAVRHAVCPTILIHICVCGHVCVCVSMLAHVRLCALVYLVCTHARTRTHAQVLSGTECLCGGGMQATALTQKLGQTMRLHCDDRSCAMLITKKCLFGCII